VLGAACLGVLVEAFVPRHQRWAAQVALTLAALVAAGVLLAASARSGAAAATPLSGALSGGKPTLFLLGTLRALGVGGGVLIAGGWVERGGAFVVDAAARGGGAVPAAGVAVDRITAGRVGMQTEVMPLTLFALGGMMAFCAANDLLTMFVALE